MANTPQSRKSKGRRFQQQVIKMLIDALEIDPADIENRSMGCNGEDVILSNAARKKFPFSIECKNTEKLNIWSALEQATANSVEYPPIVLFRRNRSKAYACLELETLLDLMREINEQQHN